MEQWEIDYREELEESLEQGAYHLGIGNIQIWTGKGGYIEHLVEMRRYTINNKVVDLPSRKQKAYTYEKITYEKIKKFIEDALYGN